MDASVPQTDREFLIQLAGHMDKLSGSIDNLSEVVINQEVRRIAPIEDKVTKLEKWKAEMSGIWKTVIAISSILSILSLINSLVNHG